MSPPGLDRLALFARRRYGIVFLAAAALVALSLAAAFRLRFETDFLALLPRDEPAVRSFRQALEEFGSIDYLLVAVRVPESAPLEPYESFVDRLGDALAGMEEMAEVQYRVGELEELIEAFLPTALLFLDRQGLDDLAARLTDERLRERARELRRLIFTPQSLALKTLIQLDPLGVAPVFLDRLTTTRGGMALDWSRGYLMSRDRRMLLLLAKPARPPQDVEFAGRLVRLVEARLAEVGEGWPEIVDEVGPPPPEVALGGRYVIALGDADLIRRDVVTSVSTSMAGVLLLFLLAFRRPSTLLYAFVPLLFGLVLSFGFSSLSFGALSSTTGAAAALLIGLGIDFVIVSYGRFVEERRRGRPLETALSRMSLTSGRAVVVGAVTSAATFYAFGVTDFTGLYQMGYLTGTGILFCMAGVLLLLPAMLAFSEDRQRRARRGPRHVLHGFGSGLLIRWSLARPGAALAAGALVTAAAAYFLGGLRFEDSVQSMRPRGNPGVEIRDEVATRFGSGFDQMMLILRADSLERLVELTDEAVERSAELVERGVLTGVDGLPSVLPPLERQRRVLEILDREREGSLDPARIRTVFGRALAAEGLRFEAFEQGLGLFERALARRRPLTLEELHASPHVAGLLDRYLRRSTDGWQGVVYLHPPPRVWRREPPPDVERIAASFGDRAVLTGANVISEVLRVRVVRDAVRASILGFVLVALLLWLDFRRLDDTVLTLVPLVLGIVWMLGAMAALDLPMNFMNIFVSTMIIGIGVDYGVHMVHRRRELVGAPADELGAGLVETGKAIVLAALSTVVGFGSLATSHYPGLSSMGSVAILGAFCTSLVAITLLPAYLSLLGRDKARSRGAGRPSGA